MQKILENGIKGVALPLEFRHPNEDEEYQTLKKRGRNIFSYQSNVDNITQVQKRNRIAM